MITLEQREWNQIRLKIKADWAHKPSVLLIREVMKRELGFTTRNQREYDSRNGRHTEHVHLDFYDEAMVIIFRL